MTTWRRGRHLPLALTGLTLAAACLGCGGDPPLLGEFTSDIVQLNSCRLVGDDDRERCVRDEVTSTLRTTLVEDDLDRVWLIGVPREGEDDRRLLGTRDSEGGFLFYDETISDNADNECTLTTEILLTLAVEEGASPEAVGTDPCVALVGRETRTVTSSEGCDGVNDPPARIERISRRRWEPSASCGMDE